MNKSDAEFAVQKLSKREGEVLALLAKGGCRKSIPDAMGVEVATVDSFLRRIRRKLGTTTCGAAAMFAVARGEI